MLDADKLKGIKENTDVPESSHTRLMLDADKLKRIKDSPWFWFVALLFGAFASGFGAYPGLMTLLDRTHVSNAELKKLRDSAETLPRVNERLSIANTEAQAQAAEIARLRPSATPSPTQSVLPSPITLRGSGTAETNVIAVSAAPFARTVRIATTATTRALVGGSMHIEVAGTSPSCRSGVHYRNPDGPPQLTAQVACEETVPAGQSREYIAKAPTNRADAQTIDIEVTVRPQ